MAFVTGARKSGNEEDKEERREESRIKEEKERKGRNSWREGRNSISLCTRSAGQTFQDRESFLGLPTSENKICEMTEEQTAVRPRA